MYNPKEANKSYTELLKEKGISSSLKSAIFVLFICLINKYLGEKNVPVLELVIIYFFFCGYFTWKPKLIRFLRGKLRGEEFRNKSDQ
jgi:hypothetical protein